MVVAFLLFDTWSITNSRIGLDLVVVFEDVLLIVVEDFAVMAGTFVVLVVEADGCWDNTNPLAVSS